MKNYGIYIVKDSDNGQPLKRSRYSDLPRHADMLRYDSAYHDPNDISRIIFPQFRGYDQIIHHERWTSFVLKVEHTEEFIGGWKCMDWIGYWNNPDLISETLQEFLQRTRMVML